jgi:peptide/nickel transport system permease protein
MDWLPDHVVSNIVTLLIVAVSIAAARVLGRHAIWRAMGRELWRRRPLTLCVVGLFVVVGLLDSLSWVGGGPETARDLVTLHMPRTIVDRLFPIDFQERSYSAPFADSEFYGGAPLHHPHRHVFGTDILGRDVLRLTLKGVRVALLVGGFTSLIAAVLAVVLGVAAGYFGRRVDDFVFFLVSTLASMPGLLLLIALIMVLGRGTVQVCIALGVTSWVTFCRLVRGETLKLRELEYVQAANALGAGHLRIIVFHILPNLLHLVIIRFVLLFSAIVLVEAILSWLGVGIEGSWGQMIDQARNELSRTPIIWWNLAGASVALFVLVLAVNLLADAMRDIIDPRTRREER